MYLCPPESSPSDSFHASPNATLNSSPSRMLRPSGATSFALAPGSRVEKMDPKSFVRSQSTPALDTFVWKYMSHRHDHYNGQFQGWTWVGRWILNTGSDCCKIHELPVKERKGRVFTQYIRRHHDITSVVHGVDMLSALQLATLQDLWRVAVYDR